MLLNLIMTTNVELPSLWLKLSKIAIVNIFIKLASKFKFKFNFGDDDRRGSFPKPNLKSKPNKKKEINVFICHYEEDIADDLVQAFKTYEKKEKVKIKISTVNNELEFLYKIQLKYESFVLYDIVFIGDNFKLLDTNSIVTSLKEMVEKGVLNNVKIVPLISNDEVSKEESKKLGKFGIKDILYCPFSDSNVENVIKVSI